MKRLLILVVLGVTVGLVLMSSSVFAARASESCPDGYRHVDADTKALQKKDKNHNGMVCLNRRTDRVIDDTL